jgi:hypothetical protein
MILTPLQLYSIHFFIIFWWYFRMTLTCDTKGLNWIEVHTSRGWFFLFGLVFIKKTIKLKFKKKMKINWNRFKPIGFGSVQFFWTKPVQTGFARFFRFGSVFSGFLFGFGSVRFFRFQTYKTETKLVSFFKILICLIGFFSRFGFFHSGFLNLISFLVFFSPLDTRAQWKYSIV